MPLLLADFIYSRDCKLNLRKNVDTTKFLWFVPGNSYVRSCCFVCLTPLKGALPRIASTLVQTVFISLV